MNLRPTLKTMPKRKRKKDSLVVSAAMLNYANPLRAALLKCREEFCWHGNTGKKLHADSYAELVDMIDKALGDE